MLTRDDFKQIEEYFKRIGRKTSDLISASFPLKGNEKIAIVQREQSKHITIEQLKNSFNQLTIPSFCNINDTYSTMNNTLQSAIAFIPVKSRIAGQYITFTNEENEWVTYQFTGLPMTQWNTLELWIKK